MSIVVGAGYFVYQQVFVNTSLLFRDFIITIKNPLNNKPWFFLVIFSFSIVNWFLEILKWQVLVGYIQPISFRMAMRQSLSSHTLSLITPFKSGEYAAKILYYDTSKRKKIALLNFVGNMVQLIITLILGIIGFGYFLLYFNMDIHPRKIRFIGFIIAFIILLLVSGNKRIPYKKKGYYWQQAFYFTKKISSKIKIQILELSLLRYLVFSHQFYLILLIFGINLPYITAILLIFTMYFLATLLPVMSLFDFVIKGSVAIYLFRFAGVDEGQILSVSLLMWLFNFVIPAVLGSYYVFSFKLDPKKSVSK